MKKLRPYLVPLVALLTARLIYSHFVKVNVLGDAGAYLNAAKNLAINGFIGQAGQPDYARPPLSSIMLAGFTKLGFNFEYWTYVLFNCIVDSISLILLIKVALRILPNTAWLGIFLIALSPMWFVHVNSPISEPVSTLVFLAFLERWTLEKRSRKDEVLAGLYLGLLTLSRGMFLWLPVSIVLFELIHFKTPKGAKLGLRGALRFVGAGFVPPLIWGARNYFVVGNFTMTQDSWTAIMMAWYVTQLPLLDWRMDEHVRWILSHKWSNVLYGRVSPDQLDHYAQLMKAEMFEFIRTQPLTYISHLGPKTLRLWINGWWNPFNYHFSPRYFGSAYIWSFVVPVLTLGTIGLLSEWKTKSVAHWRAHRIQLAMIIYITALTLPFTVDARYSLIPYTTFALWVGSGLMLVFQPRQPRK